MHKYLMLLVFIVFLTPATYPHGSTGTAWLERNTNLGFSFTALGLENRYSPERPLDVPEIPTFLFTEQFGYQLSSFAQKAISSRWSLQAGMGIQVRAFTHYRAMNYFQVTDIGKMAIVQVDFLPIYHFTQSQRKVRPYIGLGVAGGRDVAKHNVPLQRWQASVEGVAGVSLALQRFTCALELKHGSALLPVHIGDVSNSYADLTGISLKFVRTAG